MYNLIEIGLYRWGIVTDSHSNVNEFSALIKVFNTEPNHKKDAQNSHKTYLFYRTVHLMKNIRNNLLNKKRFVFPEFACNDFKINCQGGYIHWDDLYDGYDKDKELKSDLRKAQKLSDLALHPGNTKQNVPLALPSIHETTITTSRSFSKSKRCCQFFRKF